eukprot:maker-scaffold627_size122700-snap-gene-0.31 protein:Tk10651 transcript:maker-scaffold627_size122700-snap-gene-0.31-mRNA-1 annotation:"PREDICTED: uncharacterized protein LOC101744482"
MRKGAAKLIPMKGTPHNMTTPKAVMDPSMAETNPSNPRVGGIMMGIMTLALSVFSLIPMTLLLIYRLIVSRVITHMVEEISHNDREQEDSSAHMFWEIFIDAVNGKDADLPPDNDQQVQWLAMAMLIFFIASLIVLIIYAVCSGLLIYGVAKAKKWFLLPWIVCTLAFLVAYFIGICLSLFLIGIKIISVFLFFIALIEIAIAVYLWVCIVSLFQILSSPDWQQDWELRPKFSAEYDGVPSNDN